MQQFKEILEQFTRSSESAQTQSKNQGNKFFEQAEYQRKFTSNKMEYLPTFPRQDKCLANTTTSHGKT